MIEAKRSIMYKKFKGSELMQTHINVTGDYHKCQLLSGNTYGLVKKCILKHMKNNLFEAVVFDS